MCENCKIDELESSFPLDLVDVNLMDNMLEKYGKQDGSLISILQETQDIYGFLSLDAMQYIAEKTNYNRTYVYSVATFYSQFRFNPVGKYLIVQCQGTACHVNGSKEIATAICSKLSVAPGETTSDGLFTFENVACLGCCSLAPVLMINDQVYGKLTIEKATQLIEDIRLKEKKGNFCEN